MILTFKKLLSIICFLLSINSFAQFNPDFSLTAGANFPALSLNDSRLSPLSSPFVGVQINEGLFRNYNIQSSFFWTRKRSRFLSTTDIVQEGIELQLVLQKQLDDFSLNLGFTADLNTTRNFKTGPNRKGTYDPSQDLGNGNGLLILLGSGFKVSNNLDLNINYAAGVTNKSSNIQIGIAHRFGGNSKKKTLSIRKQRVWASKSKVKKLKDGTLLFRLQTLQPKIDAMKKAGLIEESEKVEKEQRELNLGLVKAFKAAYKFSNVLFFYSHSSNQVRNKNFSNIFLNDSLEVDSSITLPKREVVFTAGFKNIERDTIKIFQSNDIRENFEPIYYGGTDYTFTALVIMDDQFQQLFRPFPYYTRVASTSYNLNTTTKIFFYGLLWRKKYNFIEGVKRFDRRLSTFYNYAQY